MRCVEINDGAFESSIEPHVVCRINQNILSRARDVKPTNNAGSHNNSVRCNLLEKCKQRVREKEIRQTERERERDGIHL